MRALTCLLAGSLTMFGATCVASAPDPCTASLAKGTFAFTSIHFTAEVSGTTTSYAPPAGAGIVYFDGVSAVQTQSVLYTGTGQPANHAATGTYTVTSLNLSSSPEGVTDVCILTTSVNGRTVSYYLDTAGKSYYGVDSSIPKTIVSVQANRVS